MEPQVLIPKESHLLDQLIRSILGRVHRWSRRWSWHVVSPWVLLIPHLLSWSCSCYEPAHRRSRVKPRIPRVRGRIPHGSGVLPVRVFGVKPQVDRFSVVLEIIVRCPLDGGARRVGERGTQAAHGGVDPPLLFVPIGLGVGDQDGCGIAPGCGWRGLWP